MRQRVRPNDKCPCGSWKQFRKCCKDKTVISPPIFNEEKYRELTQDLSERFRKNAIKLCMHPKKEECSPNIIKAHSIQKEGILSRITRDGKVMLFTISNGRESTRPYILDEEGKKKATTFQNFCGHHDKIFFQEIEDRAYQGTPKQNFLFAYRVFAMELYKKKTIQKIHEDLIKERKNNPPLLEIHERALRLTNISIDGFEFIRHRFESSIQNNNFDCLETMVLTLDYEVQFACANLLELHYDLEGNTLNVLPDINTRNREIFLNIFPQNNQTYVLLSWLNEDSEFFSNLKTQIENLTEKQLIKFINNAVPCYTEQFPMNPDLWESHTQSQQEYFLNTFRDTMGIEVNRNLLSPTPYNLCKKPDEIKPSQ